MDKFKKLNKGGYGSGQFTDDELAFLKPERDPWEASASGIGYNAKFSDDDGHIRGANWNDSDDHGLRNKLADEHQEIAHQRLSRLIDGEYDQPSGPMLTGGGPVSENADDNSPGWKGSGRKGPRYSPKTGPQTNMTGWKK
jgi:hypothetical protein